MTIQYDRTAGWFNSADFAYTLKFEQQWQQIAQEARSLFDSGLFCHHSQSSAVKDHVHKLADDWRVFNLYRRGQWADTADQAPITVALLRTVPQILAQTQGLVYFSWIPEGAAIKPHVSTLAVGARVRHQLCLTPTEGYAVQDLYFDINGDRRTWQQGRTLSFDDAYRHHVVNTTDQPRMVLLYDALGHVPSK